MKIKKVKRPATQVLFVRGVEAANIDYLKRLAKKKGYKQMSDLINTIIEEVKRSEHV